MRTAGVAIGILAACCVSIVRGETVALWLFDEHAASYPSTYLNDAGPNHYGVVLGRGAVLRPGRFGNALSPVDPPPLVIRSRLLNDVAAQAAGERPIDPDEDLVAKAAHFGLVPPPEDQATSADPLHWRNATFAALLPFGERHLRSGGFANPTVTRLNLGAFDWTVEFWRRGDGPAGGVVFEVGSGPRGSDSDATQIALDGDDPALVLTTRHGETEESNVRLAARGKAFDCEWRHWALVHRGGDHRLTLYVDGRRASTAVCKMHPLGERDEAYLTIGADGAFERRLCGRLDELRISDHMVYEGDFEPPGSFSATYSGEVADETLGVAAKRAPSLLFDEPTEAPYELGARKHVFLDDALVERMQGVQFKPNPPLRVDKVIDYVKGHMSVVDDGQGGLRLYCEGPRASLAVLVSDDGLHWRAPDVGEGEFAGKRNVVIRDQVGLGVVFRDPNGPEEHRWKYVSGVRRQGIFLYTSPDGLHFKRHETAVLPFAAGSQSCVYYDDQRRLYVAHHRSDYGMTRRGSTRRRFVVSETDDLYRPWPFERVTADRIDEATAAMRIKNDVLDPWFLDNGPLCPPGLSIELPTVFQSDDDLDQAGTDIYVTKALKYPWAPDAYVAFPSVYYHYWNAAPRGRRVLGDEQRQRGSGVAEVQLAVSRDGLSWRRYPRPTYVPNGGLGRNDVHLVFMAHGMVRRGDEIWQFVGGHGGNGVGYHSAWVKGAPSPLWRVVQRVDGFAAAESDYDGGWMVTKPFVFDGSRLALNVDTGATGFVQVGLQTEDGEYIDGFHVDKCVYVNGDFLDTEVEWLDHGRDVSSLAGKPVRLYFRTTGSKLFAFEFR